MHEIDLMLKLQMQGRTAEARKLSDKLEAIGPNKILDAKGKNTEDIWHRHCFNRGWFLLQEGKYQEACKLLEYGRILNTYGNRPIDTKNPLYDPKIHSLKGKKILIVCEGGYGDEIIHARFATSYKKLGALQVILAAAPDILSVFSRIDGVDNVIARSQINDSDFDYWIPAFSAGWLAGHTIDDLPSDPYLSPLPQKVELWKKLLHTEKKIKIGIRWAGNPKFEHQQLRKFPPEYLINLRQYSDVQLYSLQRDFNVIDLPEDIIDLQNILISWEDTIAAIKNLDIVITSCTSIAHIAAAIGKETWVISPILPYHTWAYGSPESTTTPYYKCVKVYRQKKPNSWNETFQILYRNLEEKFQLPHLDLPNKDLIYQKLNLGCGLKNIENFVNVDKLKYYQPDVVHDLNKLPWPFEDDQFDHVVAAEVLQQLGETKQDLVKILEELVRVTVNGGLWEVQIPFFRSDRFAQDINNRHELTIPMFGSFNKKVIYDTLLSGKPIDLFALSTDIDIEILDHHIEFTKSFQDTANHHKIPEDELLSYSHVNNNIIDNFKMLIQVYKPGRVDNNDIRTAVQTFRST